VAFAAETGGRRLLLQAATSRHSPSVAATADEEPDGVGLTRSASHGAPSGNRIFERAIRLGDAAFESP
jgi:hypothetical protein